MRELHRQTDCSQGENKGDVGFCPNRHNVLLFAILSCANELKASNLPITSEKTESTYLPKDSVDWTEIDPAPGPSPTGLLLGCSTTHLYPQLQTLRIQFSLRLRSLLLLLSPVLAFAQDVPAPAQQPVPAPAQTPPAATAPASTAQAATGPDYPDPRTFTIGVFYWFSGPGAGPDLRGGKLARGYESLFDLGKAHKTPGVEFSLPISRTGTLHLEGFRTQGTGNQTLTAGTTLFGSDFNAGDLLATSYGITSAKFYLDDLLFPHKFPVARLRFKSLWEVQYVGFKSSVDAINGSLSTGTGSRTIFLPTFGLAAEYAIAPHVLFRVAGSGFGIPHRAVIWDGEATLSVRQKKIEFVGGAKAFHFKSSPNNEIYAAAEVYGGFVGLRYHFGQ